MVKNFTFYISSRSALESTRHLIQGEPGALSPVVKRQGREADNSVSTSDEVKKTGSINSLPHTPSCRDAQLVKHRDSFTSNNVYHLQVIRHTKQLFKINNSQNML
jgi:hypothetical protein